MATDYTIRSLYRHIGREIAARRKGKLTQGQLAKVVGISRTSVTNLEKGRQRIPLHYLLHIAEALNCEIRDFIPPRSSLATARDAGDIEIVGTLTPGIRAVLHKYATPEEEHS